MRRPPWTLWRHYTLDLARVAALTASVLVTVIAFAGAVKPISDGLLAATDALKYILLGIPPMLAYALPFAGGFAATLVYHRMTTDLEASAAYAGGVSHRALLGPAFAVALVCGASLVALNEQVIPRFLERMQRLVTMDVARLIAQRVERGDGVAFKGLMLYADAVQRVPPAPDSGVLDQLLLKRFAAVVHEDYNPRQEVTAETAKVWLVPAELGGGGRAEEGSTRVLVKLENVAGVMPGKGLYRADQISDLTWTVPNAFRDNVKFLTYGEMSRLREHPERINWVEYRRQALGYTLAERRTFEMMVRDAREGRPIELVDARGKRVIVRAAAFTWEGDRWVFHPMAGEASVALRIEPAGGVRPVAVAAGSAALINEPTAEAAGQRLVMRVTLERLRVREGQSPEVELPAMVLGGLTYARSPLGDYADLPSRELLAAAGPWLDRPEPDPVVAKAVRLLNECLVRLDRDITSKRNERMALMASCVLMILTGAVTAMGFSGRRPLAVYLLTFFPALACMVTISGGQQLTIAHGAAGLWLMWGGVAGLGAYLAVMFVRLARH